VSGQPIGIVIGDLDHFKTVNDTLGHTVGDAVLTDVAYLMRKQLRAFDLAYRLGGEEFLVLLPGADLEQTEKMAELLRQEVAAGEVGGGQRVSMSFGVSASPHGSVFDYSAVFAEADAALYEAKRSGRNRVCCRVHVGPDHGAVRDHDVDLDHGEEPVTQKMGAEPHTAMAGISR